MNPSEFIHPEDAAALKQLENIPGLPTLLKKFFALGFEKYNYGVNMASAIRLSPSQLPELYSVLPPICQTLGIKEPEFYLQMDPMPNAWTFGDTRIFITVTSGLVEMLTREELISVVGHECGHILCRHVLYHNLANLIVNGTGALGLLGPLLKPVELALLYWMRKSELSCDRAGAIVTSPEVVSRVQVRLAGGPKSITEKVNIEEWAKQADIYESIRDGSTWDKALQLYATAGIDHPFAAVRVREILRWGQTPQYQKLRQRIEDAKKKGSNAQGDAKCPKCHSHVEPDWKFCRHCGAKL